MTIALPIKLVNNLKNWFYANWFLVMVGLLFAFIPLYPKLPLLEILPSYRVRLRLEDVLVGIVSLTLAWQAFRKHLSWKHQVSKLMATYMIIGLLSIISALFIVQSIPLLGNHVLKSFLHWIRYGEYFLLSFLLFSVSKKPDQIQWLLKLLSGTVLIAALYGLGQKLFAWPLVSTMLREFSTGQVLYLTEGARIQSTFAGHYDLAAYMVITTPFLLAWFFTAQKKVTKVYLGIILLLTIWIIIESASRISFIAFYIAISLVPLLLLRSNLSWQKNFRVSAQRFLALLVIVATMFVMFGSQLQLRFIQVISIYKPIAALYSQLFPMAVVPNDNVLTPSDARPIPFPPDKKPVDVIVDVPDLITTSTTSATGEVITTTVEQERVFSTCAQEKSLSLCIRLEELWPQAVTSFWKNPLLGTGYATLNKKTLNEFTEAESTDNNLLRTLGETGLLGFISFYGIIMVVCYLCLKRIFNSKIQEPIAVALIAASVGLIINAIYIDVFAASKVAFTYWGLVGLGLGYLQIQTQKRKH